MDMSANKSFQYMPRTLLRFEVQVAEHCNLNCRNCMHYAPLAKPELLDISEYARDCRRLSELFDSEAEWIHLMGGEPLLHPEIIEIMRISRENFRYGRIQIVTNGILLLSMQQDFWDACHKYKIELRITKYPISLDYGKIEEKGREEEVEVAYYNNDRSKMWRWPVDVKGSKDPVRNFYNCPGANICHNLRKGKMYTCATPAHAHHLKDFFGLEIALSERNGIDIYQVENAEELMEKLSRPIPFCRYCQYAKKDDYADEWSMSLRDRYEWISFRWDEEDIRYIKDASEVYIFGAGRWGKEVVRRLQGGYGITIKTILVTSADDNADSISHVPVIPLEHIGIPDKDSICILAVDGKAKIEIQERLYRKGFRKIIPIMNLE